MKQKKLFSAVISSILVMLLFSYQVYAADAVSFILETEPVETEPVVNADESNPANDTEIYSSNGSYDFAEDEPEAASEEESVVANTVLLISDRDKDFEAKNVVRFTLPPDLDFFIDPIDLVNNGTLFSPEYSISNYGSTDVILKIQDLVYHFSDNGSFLSCADFPDRETERYEKAIFMFLRPVFDENADYTSVNYYDASNYNMSDDDNGDNLDDDIDDVGSYDDIHDTDDYDDDIRGVSSHDDDIHDIDSYDDDIHDTGSYDDDIHDTGDDNLNDNFNDEMDHDGNPDTDNRDTNSYDEDNLNTDDHEDDDLDDDTIDADSHDDSYYARHYTGADAVYIEDLDYLITDQLRDDDLQIILRAADYDENGNFIALNPGSTFSFKFMGGIADGTSAPWLSDDVWLQMIYSFEVITPEYAGLLDEAEGEEFISGEETLEDEEILGAEADLEDEPSEDEEILEDERSNLESEDEAPDYDDLSDHEDTVDDESNAHDETLAFTILLPDAALPNED